MKRKLLQILILCFVCIGLYAQNEGTPNLDFSTGRFDNWERYIGNYYYNSTDDTYYYSDWTLITGNSNRFAISSNGKDGIVYCDLQTSPINVSAARIGMPKARERESQPNGTASEKLSYKFLVNENNTLLTYKLAAVLNVPDDSSHFGDRLPAFEVEILVKDKIGNIYNLPCSSYTSKADFKNPQLIRNKTKAQCPSTNSTTPQNYQYQPWITSNVDLSAHIGDSVFINVLNHDCLSTSGNNFHVGGHEAYGYFWAETKKIELTSSSCEDSEALLIAPEGFDNYKWERSDGYLIPTNNDTLIVDKTLNFDNVTYTCEMSDANNSCGSIKVSKTISQAHLFPDFTSNAVEAGKIQFTNTSTVLNDTISSYYWDFGDGTTSNQKNPIHEYTQYTPFDVKLTISTKQGCSKYKINSVLPTKELIATLTPNDSLQYNGQTKDCLAKLNVTGLQLNFHYFIRYKNQVGTPFYNGYSAPAAVGKYTATFELSFQSLLKYFMKSVPSIDFEITKAPLKITVNNVTKTYGETISLASDGFTQNMKPLYAGDKINTLELSCEGLNDTSSVKTYYIIPTLAKGDGVGNYDIAFVKGTLNVLPKPITLKAALSASKFYGTPIIPTGKEFSIAAGSLVGKDSVFSVAVHSDGLDELAECGIHKITIDGAIGRRLNNYTLSYDSAELEVKKKEITVKASDLSKDYGTIYNFTGREFSTDLSQFEGNDSIAHVQLSSMATAQKAAWGKYEIKFEAKDVTGYRLNNYDITCEYGNFSVAQMSLTIRAQVQSKIYGDVLSFTGREFTTDKPLIAGDTILVVAMSCDGSPKTAAVDTFDIVPSQAYGVGLTNYDIKYNKAALEVLKRTISPVLNAPIMQYNGKNKDFTVTGDVAGLIEGVNADYIIHYTNGDSTAHYDSNVAPTKVGNYVATFELNNRSLPSYQLDATVQQKFRITPAPLTITVDGIIKTYGDVLTLRTNVFNTNLKPLYSSSDNIDALKLKSDGLADTASVKIYDILLDTLIGNGLENYSIKYELGKVTVQPKLLTVKLLDMTKTYGEALIPTGKEFAITPGSLVGNDTVSSVLLQCGGFDTLAEVKLYPITALNATGRGINNYTLGFSTATLQVQKKEITVRAKKLTKQYGTSYAFTGKEYEIDTTKFKFVGNDSIEKVEFLPCQAIPFNAKVDSYGLEIKEVFGNRLGNYTISPEKNTFSVSPKPITITVKDQQKSYGEVYVFTGKEYTTDSVLVKGDSITLIQLNSVGGMATTLPGRYDIDASTIHCAALLNYVFTVNKGKFTVDQKLIHPTLIAPSNLMYTGTSKVFNASIDVSGLVQGEDYFIKYSNVNGTPYMDSLQAPIKVGNYTATFELSPLSKLKYKLDATVQQAFRITPAPLTITIDNAVKTYGNVLYLGTSAYRKSINTLYNSSDYINEIRLKCSGLADTASVKTYDILADTIIGQGLENYVISCQKGELTVNAKPLTIKAPTMKKTYGSQITPTGNEFSITSGSLVGNDTIRSVSIQCNGFDQLAAVGSDTILISNPIGRGLGNYSISCLGGKLNVEKKKITVAANAITKEYGTQVSFNGTEYSTDTLQFVGNDRISAVELSSKGALNTTSIGVYDLKIDTIVGAGLTNYDITQLNSTLKVNPVTIHIKPNAMSKPYGTLLVFNGNEFSIDRPLLNGDTITYALLKSAGCAETAQVGNFDVELSMVYGAGINNYEFKYDIDTLWVLKKQISATLYPPLNLVYNATEKNFTATVDIPGLVQNRDYFIRYTSKDGVYNSYSAPVNVGNYTATFELSGLSLLKYSLSTIPTINFNISKAPLVITAENATKTYGEKLQLLGDAFRMDMNPLFGSDAVFMVDFVCAGFVDTATVKTYPILPQNAKGTGIENYEIKYVGGLLTVNMKPLLIKATDSSKTYGDVTFSNSKNFYVDSRDLVANDMVTSVTLASDGYASLATTGAHPIKASNAVGLGMKNYLISYADGNLQVLKKKISVSAKPIYKEYGCEYVFRSDEFTVAASQLVGSDKITGVKLNSQGAQSNASVGEYTLVISEVVGNGVDNYDITPQNAVLFVTPKPIVVIGANLEKEFGDVLTFAGNEFTTDMPLLNNDTISFTYLKSIGTAATAPIGVYDIIPAQASGAGSLNYSISYRPAKLTVVQKQLQVTAKNLVKEYGEAEPDKSFTVADKRGVAYQTSIFTGKLSREQGEKVGLYKITKGNLAVAPSYSYTFTEGELSIVKALPSIDPVFSNNGGQSIIADVIGSKNADYPQGNLNIIINDACIDNTTSVLDGVSKTTISALPDHMVQVELNYLGDDNYLPTSTTMNVYALIYHCNGGKVQAPITHFDGNEAVKIENPTHDDNYKFDGWYDNPDFSGIAIRRLPVATYHDVHLYAKWSVTYDDLSIVVLFNQVLAVANPLNHQFLYNSTYKWFKDDVQLESNKQYCGFENFVPSGNYRVEIYYMSNPAIVVELAHSSTMQKAKLYPNPMKRNSQLTVCSELAKEKDVSVEIYTLLGSRLNTITVEKDGEKFKLNGFNHSGVYMVRLVQNGVMTESHKVIVEE